MTTLFIIFAHFILFSGIGLFGYKVQGSGICGDLYHVTNPKVERFIRDVLDMGRIYTKRYLLVLSEVSSYYCLCGMRIDLC